MSHIKEYAFTIKDNRVNSIQYDEFFDRISSNRLEIVDSVGELDSRGKLHYHGIIRIPDTVYRKSLCPQGFHLILKQMSDREGWEAYYKKGQPCPEDPDTNDNKLMDKLKNVKLV